MTVGPRSDRRPQAGGQQVVSHLLTGQGRQLALRVLSELDRLVAAKLNDHGCESPPLTAMDRLDDSGAG